MILFKQKLSGSCHSIPEVLLRTGKLLLALMLLSGCESNSENAMDDNADDDNDATAIAQIADLTAQKGPFASGALVTLTRINQDGEATDDEVTTYTEADGSFDSPELDWEGPTMVTVTGPFFDEYQGQFTTEEFTLRAFPSAADGAVDTNVNLLTHILARYIEYWMADGDEYEELLNDDGIPYLNDFFGINAAPGELNLLDNLGAENIDASSRSLLLLSAAFLKAGLDQQALDQIADDFAKNEGEIDIDGPALQDFRLWMTTLFEDPYALYSQARTALNDQYNRTDELPDQNVRFVFGNLCDALETVLCGEYSDIGDLKIPPDGLTLSIWPRYSGSHNIWIGYDFDLSWRVREESTDTQVFPPDDGAYWRRMHAGYGNVGFVKLEGGNRYLLDIRNSSDEVKTGESATMSIISYGRAWDPVWIPADNEQRSGRAGVSIAPGGRGDSTTSFYRIQGTAGGYRLTFNSLSCGFTGNLGFSIRVLQWDDANTTSANSTTNGYLDGSVKASTKPADLNLCEVSYDFAISRGNSGFISIKNNRSEMTEYAPGYDRYQMTLELMYKL